MGEIDKKIVLTYIKHYFEYYTHFVKDPEVDETEFLRNIIFFCEEYKYPALEIFLLGGLASFRYPELQLTTGWSDQQMIYVNELCLSWSFDGYKLIDPVINKFFKTLDQKIKQDRIKYKW